MSKTPLSAVPAEEERKKGVVFTYGDCNDRVLHGAIEKLDNYTGWSAKDLSRFNKICNAYEQKSKEAGKLFQKLLKKHANTEIVMKKNDNGVEEPVMKDDGKPMTRPKMIQVGRGRMDYDFKNRKAFNKDYADLMTEEFKIEAFCLMTEDLIKAGLTPKEIRACTKFLSDGDPDFIKETPKYDEDEDDEELDDEDDEEATVEAVAEAPKQGASASDTPEVSNVSAGGSNEPGATV